MIEKRLQEIESFVQSWTGERDADCYMIDGPEWDTDDMVLAMSELLLAYKKIVGPTGYTIHDGGECRPVIGNVPEVGHLVVCHRDPLTVTEVTLRKSNPTGFDRWYDVRTKKSARKTTLL